jgi:hypothetical protein
VPGTWSVLAVLALLQAQAVDEVVVTTAPSMDAQRLADALRVYLDEYGIRVEPRAAPDAADLRERLEGARKLGETVRALAVVRAEHGARETIEIELYDLATDKAVVVSVPRPARDEDLYRALALKIQSVLRATLSEARADLDPSSSAGRLVAREVTPLPPPASPATAAARPRLGLDAGYGFVSFPNDGPLFGGLAVRASWRPRQRLELALGTAALSSASASNGAVDATASVIPIRASVRIPFAIGGSEILLGPCVDATFVRVAAASTTTPVRSTRNLMLGVGAEAEARLVVLGSAWLFARAAIVGVFNGERYEAGGTPLFDTSRVQLSGSIGAGVGLP